MTKPIGPLERKLMACLMNDDYEGAAELLAKGGIDLNAEVERGKPMLSRFTVIGHVEATEWLLERGAKPDAALYGVSPVFYAAREGDLAMLKSMVARGGDINKPGPGGMTPIFAAAWNGHGSVFAELLEMGANTSLVDKEGRDCFKVAALNRNIGPDFVASLRNEKLDYVGRHVSTENVEPAAPDVVAAAAAASTRKRF